MIRVNRGREVSPGVFAYTVHGMAVEGRSAHPLCDACRKIQALDASTVSQEIGIWREGASEPTFVTKVGVAAALTVRETRDGPIFLKYRKFDRSFIREEE